MLQRPHQANGNGENLTHRSCDHVVHFNKTLISVTRLLTLTMLSAVAAEPPSPAAAQPAQQKYHEQIDESAKAHSHALQQEMVASSMDTRETIPKCQKVANLVHQQRMEPLKETSNCASYSN